ncbi:hypothetical protein DFP72DRAFT_897895 [Ephemerocybe angulata]|uniref:Uncharacterized protein n=1 Tax=Ephemerocybe angulata TaxID=980116 RepID=A0A8H6HZY1_9AGAR|nr:hypothetical protein DFP72DRAFT_897895 [Tulosesus angulatus]
MPVPADGFPGTRRHAQRRLQDGTPPSLNVIICGKGLSRAKALAGNRSVVFSRRLSKLKSRSIHGTQRSSPPTSESPATSRQPRRSRAHGKLIPRRKSIRCVFGIRGENITLSKSFSDLTYRDREHTRRIADIATMLTSRPAFHLHLNTGIHTSAIIPIPYCNRRSRNLWWIILALPRNHFYHAPPSAVQNQPLKLAGVNFASAVISECRPPTAEDSDTFPMPGDADRCTSHGVDIHPSVSLLVID